MPYTQNPFLPRLRMEAVCRVAAGQSIRAVARHYGVHPSTVLKWTRKAEPDGRAVIPTASSRPEHHPRELAPEVVERILAVRAETKRCAEVVHALLLREGTQVSLSSVQRTLRRYGVTKNRTFWRKKRVLVPRPLPEAPGTLVEVDTVHIHPLTEHPWFYLYTLIDVHSRWAHATVVPKISTAASVRFIQLAQDASPFAFQLLQSDNGPEFSRSFTERVHIRHRHSRVRRPNDNAHLERFNRTIQEECFGRVTESFAAYRRVLPEYLRYYNAERPHMSLDMRAPLQVLPSY